MNGVQNPRRRYGLIMVATTVVLMIAAGCTPRESPTATGPVQSSASTEHPSTPVPKPTAPKRREPSTSKPAPTPVPVARPPATAVSPPVKIEIPAMSIDQDLVGLRVNRADGTLTPPSEWSDIGWWSAGPAPGAPGAAVIAGHVDSETGPAVFAGLGSLKNGAKVVIDRADGSVATYAVYKSEYFDRSHFPSDVVYRETGPTELHLVTCTGRYDHSAHHYSQNYVVFAELIHDTWRSS